MLITFKVSHTMAQVITGLVNASSSVLAWGRGALVNVKVTFSA